MPTIPAFCRHCVWSVVLPAAFTQVPLPAAKQPSRAGLDREVPAGLWESLHSALKKRWGLLLSLKRVLAQQEHAHAPHAPAYNREAGPFSSLKLRSLYKLLRGRVHVPTLLPARGVKSPCLQLFTSPAKHHRTGTGEEGSPTAVEGRNGRKLGRGRLAALLCTRQALREDSEHTHRQNPRDTVSWLLVPDTTPENFMT